MKKIFVEMGYHEYKWKCLAKLMPGIFLCLSMFVLFIAQCLLVAYSMFIGGIILT